MSYWSEKSANGRKIARVALISTIFGLIESQRHDLFLKTFRMNEKFSKSSSSSSPAVVVGRFQGDTNRIPPLEPEPQPPGSAPKSWILSLHFMMISIGPRWQSLAQRRHWVSYPVVFVPIRCPKLIVLTPQRPFRPRNDHFGVRNVRFGVRNGRFGCRNNRFGLRNGRLGRRNGSFSVRNQCISYFRTPQRGAQAVKSSYYADSVSRVRWLWLWLWRGKVFCLRPKNTHKMVFIDLKLFSLWFVSEWFLWSFCKVAGLSRQRNHLIYAATAASIKCQGWLNQGEAHGARKQKVFDRCEKALTDQMLQKSWHERIT